MDIIINSNNAMENAGNFLLAEELFISEKRLFPKELIMRCQIGWSWSNSNPTTTTTTARGWECLDLYVYFCTFWIYTSTSARFLGALLN